jgi:hypothetical protein
VARQTSLHRAGRVPSAVATLDRQTSHEDADCGRPAVRDRNRSGSPGIATFLAPDRRLSFGASQGFVELWLDGVHQTLARGYSNVRRNDPGEPNYFKAGIYRSSASTGVSVIERDNIVVGTSLDAVRSF